MILKQAKAAFGLTANVTATKTGSSGSLVLGKTAKTVNFTTAVKAYFLRAVFAGPGDLLNLVLRTNVTSASTAWVAGAAQVTTATAAGTVSAGGNASVVVTSAGMAGSPKTLAVAVATSDTPTLWAAKVRTALAADAAVAARFTVGGSTTAIVLTRKPTATFVVPSETGTLAIYAANDATLNVALATGTGSLAALLALGFHCLLRPGEMCRLTRYQVRLPGDAGWHAAVGIVVINAPKTAKTASRLQHVVIHDRVVLALCRVMWGHLPSETLLGVGNTHVLEQWFRRAMTVLLLKEKQFTPAGLRAGWGDSRLPCGQPGGAIDEARPMGGQYHSQALRPRVCSASARSASQDLPVRSHFGSRGSRRLDGRRGRDMHCLGGRVRRVDGHGHHSDSRPARC